MDHIVVGVDGSPGSQRALVWAAEEARLRGAVLVPVHAWDVPVVTASPIGVLPSPIDDDLLADGARGVLDGALADVDLTGVTVEPAIVAGSAAGVLVDRAADAALLVIGAAGHGALLGTLLGSVSQYCVRHAKVPVVVVPH